MQHILRCSSVAAALWLVPDTAPWLQISEEQRALRDMACLVCKGVLKEPVSTPCGHHFCKPCLEKKFAVRESSAGLLAQAATAGHVAETVLSR